MNEIREKILTILERAYDEAYLANPVALTDQILSLLPTTEEIEKVLAKTDDLRDGEHLEDFWKRTAQALSKLYTTDTQKYCECEKPVNNWSKYHCSRCGKPIIPCYNCGYLHGSQECKDCKSLNQDKYCECEEPREVTKGYCGDCHKPLNQPELNVVEENRVDCGSNKIQPEKETRFRECPHCKENIYIRNPSGYCDHLHYPENCKICQRVSKPEKAEIEELKNDILGADYYKLPPELKLVINKLNELISAFNKGIK